MNMKSALTFGSITVGHKLFRTILVSMVIASIGSLPAASEAWVLEMPEKHAEFLMKAALSQDLADYERILAKLPALIEDQVITEVESFLRTPENENERQIHGTVIPHTTFPFHGAQQTSGGFYGGGDYGSGHDYCWLRLRYPKTKDGIPEFNVVTLRKPGQIWFPTFIYAKNGNVRVLLERDQKAPVKRSPVLEKLVLSAEAPDYEHAAVTWLVSAENIDNGISVENMVFGPNGSGTVAYNDGFSFKLSSNRRNLTPNETPDFTVKAGYLRSVGNRDIYHGFWKKDLKDVSLIEGDLAKRETTFDPKSGESSTDEKGKEGKFCFERIKCSQ